MNQEKSKIIITEDGVELRKSVDSPSLEKLEKRIQEISGEISEIICDPKPTNELEDADKLLHLEIIRMEAQRTHRILKDASLKPKHSDLDATISFKESQIALLDSQLILKKGQIGFEKCRPIYFHIIFFGPLVALLALWFFR